MEQSTQQAEGGEFAARVRRFKTTGDRQGSAMNMSTIMMTMIVMTMIVLWGVLQQETNLVLAAERTSSN
jgi:hypothetical protein